MYQWRKALRRNIEVNCSATRFMTSCMQVELPQKPTDILRPFGGMSQIAHLRLFGIHSTKYDEFLFLASSICCVSSGTVRARYCCEPRDVSGAKPIMKKWRRGNGIRFTASLRRSLLSWPGKRRQQVVPDMAAHTRWLRSPYVGVVSFRVRKQMS